LKGNRQRLRGPPVVQTADNQPIEELSQSPYLAS
jgi:hypothetical protein